MSDLLDLAAIEARDAATIARMRPSGPSNTEWNAEPGTFEAYRERSWFDAEHDRRALLAEVTRLRAALAAAAERQYRSTVQAWDDGWSYGARGRDPLPGERESNPYLAALDALHIVLDGPEGDAR